MSNSPKLSLMSAILININIMLGSGIFINTVLLAVAAGALGGFVYAFVGLLIFPLIYTMARLMAYHEGGTFYEFGATLHPFIGFLSSWCYFTAKLASSALGIHIFVTLMQQLFESLQGIPGLYLKLALVLLFAFFNLQNIRVGKIIQYSFIVLKSIPILFVFYSYWTFAPHVCIPSEAYRWSGIFKTISFVLFAFSGFEASCSLSRSIKNPAKNGPLAIFISFSIVLAVVILYQSLFYYQLPCIIDGFDSFYQAFEALLAQGHFSPNRYEFWKTVLFVGIASSALGASYGIMYSNGWNLFALASKNTLPFSTILTQVNKYQTPYLCIIAEAFLMCLYLILTHGNQVPLQQISALGSGIAYTISVASFVLTSVFIDNRDMYIGLTALASCLLLLYAALTNGLAYGMHGYIIYCVIIVCGIVGYLTVKDNITN